MSRIVLDTLSNGMREMDLKLRHILVGRPKKLIKRDKSEVIKKHKTERLNKWVIAHCGWCRGRDHNIKKCPTKQSGEEAAKITKQAKEKRQAKKPVKQPKRRGNAKNGKTSGAADPIQEAHNVAPIEETKDSFIERRREGAARRERGVAADHNEDDGNVDILSLTEQPQNDSDIEILKVVEDTTIAPSVSQRETRRAKRAMVKLKSQQAKKKGHTY
ncbi:hypothetical protein LIER_39569 [Lithospermum erythrorhizon]|uniref:Uncharacterized protein n=1 Tax=Lithospermum erythrorhizon TaxID=34254 RepID=A0AAV3QKP4_LITER